MTNMERAAHILGVMEKGRVTQAEMGRRTRLHVNTIANALDGKHNIGVDTLQKIAEALKFSPKSLV